MRTNIKVSTQLQSHVASDFMVFTVTLAVLLRCTNCTGDYCYIVKYNNRHTSFKAQQSFFQGCLTSPIDMPLGCSQNNKGSVFCICNSTNNCNEFQNVRDEKNLTYLTCQTIDNAMWPIVENCVQPWCYKKSSSYDEERVYCTSQEKEIEMYDIGFVQTGMLLPISACYSIQVDSRFEKDQYCVYKTNKTTPFKQKVPGNIKCYAPSEIKDQRMKVRRTITGTCRLPMTKRTGILIQQDTFGVPEYVLVDSSLF
ncbi:hypothetical protein GCK72_023215 [Caenorhabditis remanei]|uniref:Uncharacterized protein n=1 Tax=Caenorhabditis remanei TaxID=31234 RepID=A0A6A5FVW2_CAERE|nr:hypothetical protein GCK72_023215 [Caenorhabditis remanei]KAF1746758.1 hypothetical protein GCK72_023215 [Caenorhabditis remanei]